MKGGRFRDMIIIKCEEILKLLFFVLKYIVEYNGKFIDKFFLYFVIE